jgi:hypothetical protein
MRAGGKLPTKTSWSMAKGRFFYAPEVIEYRGMLLEIFVQQAPGNSCMSSRHGHAGQYCQLRADPWASAGLCLGAARARPHRAGQHQGAQVFLFAGSNIHLFSSCHRAQTDFQDSASDCNSDCGCSRLQRNLTISQGQRQQGRRNKRERRNRDH